MLCKDEWTNKFIKIKPPKECYAKMNESINY